MLDRRVRHWEHIKEQRDRAFYADVYKLREKHGLEKVKLKDRRTNWQVSQPDDPLYYESELHAIRNKWDPYDGNPLEFFAVDICYFMTFPLIGMVQGHPTEEEVKQANMG